jgi:hypothetical protein
MADTGEVWQGAGAWVLCLWALHEYRGWSARLASPTMQVAARKIVHWISQNRIGMSRLAGFKSDAELAATAEREAEESVCRLRHDLDLID